LDDSGGGFKSSADTQCAIAPSPSTNQPPRSSDLQDPVQWPRLEHLYLSAGELSDRRRSIGGSDANTILSGDAERLRQLWLEKRGEAEPSDLSDKISVMLGCWTEPFNRQWYEQFTGQRVVDIGRRFTCTGHQWRRCTVDGRIESRGAIWEAKHTSAFARPEEVLERYMPQLQHNMAVTGYQQAVLSVIFGNHKFEIFEIAADWLYQIELLDAEQRFWTCVLTGKEPVAAAPPPPPRPMGTREVCLEGNNAWASAAFDWLQHREAAKLHASACTSIKALVEEDVARAFGHGIEAKRSKSGAITIREFAQ
jgi:predicted phage-related endonuclease